MILRGDWEEVGTAEFIEGKIGNGFKVRLGWTETPTDTIYCESTKNDREMDYHVVVWNSTGIRAMIAGMLLAPVMVIK